MRKILLLILVAAVMMGCANKPQTTQAQQINYQLQAITQRKNEELKVCIDKNNEDENSKIVREQVIWNDQNRPYKIELLSNNKMITDDQKRALRNYLKINLECRKIVLNAFASNTYFSEEYAIQTRYNRQLDDLYVKLLNNEMTIS